MSDARPVFIVGCPRSGTSLLRDLLRSHPRLSFPGESHFIPQFYRAYGDPRNDDEAVRLASIILRHHWVRAWRLSLDPIRCADCRSYAEVVARIYQAYARGEGRSRWGDKTPHYVAHVATLWQVFPGCRIIHIYRDGRDVALSWIATSFGPRNIYVAAQQWRSLVRRGRRAGADLPDGAYLEVPYEALLERPRSTMERICAFLDEPFVEAVLTPTPIRRNGIASPFRRSSRVSPARILPGNAGRWRTAMTHGDRGVFEAVAGDLLRELDYETLRAVPPLPAHRRGWYRFHHLVAFYGYRLTRVHQVGWLAGATRLKWARLRAGVRS